MDIMIQQMIEEPETLQGSYRLHTAPIPITITHNTIAICGTKKYTLQLHHIHTNTNAQKAKKIKIKCNENIVNEISEEDKEIIQLFEGIVEYQCDGGLIRLYGEGHQFFMRGRCGSEQEEAGHDHGHSHKDKSNENSVLGSWQVEPINLALEVSSKHFSFQGINNIRYLLAYRATKKGHIEFELQSQQQVGLTTKHKDSKQKQKQKQKQKEQTEIDFDILFINALLRSTKFQLGQVSFQLFNDSGRLMARGTPYM